SVQKLYLSLFPLKSFRLGGSRKPPPRHLRTPPSQRPPGLDPIKCLVAVDCFARPTHRRCRHGQQCHFLGSADGAAVKCIGDSWASFISSWGSMPRSGGCKSLESSAANG